MDDSLSKREHARFKTDYLERLNAMSEFERKAFLNERFRRHGNNLYFTSELWMAHPDFSEPKYCSIDKINKSLPALMRGQFNSLTIGRSISRFMSFATISSRLPLLICARIFCTNFLSLRAAPRPSSNPRG